jgi:hypothetical protein
MFVYLLIYLKSPIYRDYPINHTHCWHNMYHNCKNYDWLLRKEHTKWIVSAKSCWEGCDVMGCTYLLFSTNGFLECDTAMLMQKKTMMTHNNSYIDAYYDWREDPLHYVLITTCWVWLIIPTVLTFRRPWVKLAKVVFAQRTVYCF